MTTPDTLKTIGNTHFQSSEFLEADLCYTKALLLLGPSDLSNTSTTTKLTEERSILHANRSAALYNLHRYQAAYDEADLAHRLRPTWSKALFRKAQACEALLKFTEAVKLYKQILILDQQQQQPNNTIKQKLEQLEPLAQTEDNKPRAVRITEYINKTKSIINCPVSASLSEFDIIQDVGEGNYTTVHHARYIATGEECALKIVDKKKAERLSLRHGNLRAELRMERRLLGKLSHPGIVKLFHYFQDSSNIYFMEEFCNGKEIWSRLKIKSPPQLNSSWPAVGSPLWGLCGLRPSLCTFYLKQLVNVMAYLETQGIVHRDLKPENLMIAHGPNGEERLKLIDFGTARDLLDVWFPQPSEEDEILPRRQSGSMGKSTPGSHFVGTPEFMSPEAIHGKPADHRSDMWSLGCTAYQMMTGRTPFKGASDYLTFLKAESGQYYIPNYFTPAQRNFFEILLKVSREERCPGASVLKKHPYFGTTNNTEDTTDLVNVEGFHPSLIPPLPTPAEELVEKLGTNIWILAESRGEGPLCRYDDLVQQKAEFIILQQTRLLQEQQKSNQPTSTAVGTTTTTNTDDDNDNIALHQLQAYDLFRGWLEQRSLTSTPTVLSRLFPNPITRRFSRVQGKNFIGLTFQEESNWVRPYTVISIHASMLEEENNEQIPQLVQKLNTCKPRLVMLSHFNENQRHLFTQLHESIPIAPINNDYYSLWISGILYIILNTHAFDEEQARWFERELLLGKFNARYIVVISQHAWFAGKNVHTAEEAIESPDEVGLMPRIWRKRFLQEMQTSGVHAILLLLLLNPTPPASSSKSFTGSLKKNVELGMRCIQFETKSYPNNVRVLRILTEKVVSDTYKVDELPQEFFLEKEDVPGGNSSNNNNDY
jgi:3-phosphoinositide dependent protein kinase-1